MHEQQDQLYDSDDEFILEKNQFTAKVLSSVVPDDNIPRDFDFQRETDDEKADDELSNPDLDAGRPPIVVIFSLKLIIYIDKLDCLEIRILVAFACTSEIYFVSFLFHKIYLVWSFSS